MNEKVVGFDVGPPLIVASRTDRLDDFKSQCMQLLVLRVEESFQQRQRTRRQVLRQAVFRRKVIGSAEAEDW